MKDSTHAMPVTGILNVEQAAKILGTSPLAVHRLIARSRLKASRLGDEGHWRIVGADLDGYVKAGAQDVQPPKMGEVWIAGEDAALADRLPPVLAELAEAKKLSPEQIIEKAKKDKFATSFIFDLEATGEILAVLRGAFPITPLARLAERRERYVNWGELWAVDRIRDQARSLLEGRMDGQRTVLQRLYDSPDEYQRITAEAVSRVKVRADVVFSDHVNFIENGVSRSVRATYRLSNGKLLATYPTARLIDLAF